MSGVEDMAAKIDQEFLKKHHFWLLHILLGIGLILAWFGLLVSVPSEIDAKAKENSDKKKSIDATKAQPRATLELYNTRKQELFNLRSKRWQDMWEIQKGMYEWPTSLGEETLARTTNLSFGKEIVDNPLLDVFKTQYTKDYAALEKEVAPMQFNNGWQSVLRHVYNWRLTPESEEVWLALEDMWVQREIVRTLAKINTDAAKFFPVNAMEDPLKTRTRSFYNRTWKVDLEIADAPGGNYILKGKIKNLTERLQPFGANNELLLKVWLSDDPNAKPFEFAIEGTTLDGLKEEVVKTLPNRHKIFEGRVTGIYRVEQVFDARTVPVKRFDKIALGYTSARHSLAELEMTTFSAKAAEAEAAKAAEKASSVGGPGGSPGGPGGPGGPGPMGDVSGSGTAATSGDFTPNFLARRRYVHRTDQVRSMPIGITVVADQTYSADVLTVLANSRLRLQIVQSHLARFRGTISYTGNTGGNPTFPGGSPDSGEFGGSRPGGSPMPPGGPGFPMPPGGAGFPMPPGGPGFPGGSSGYPGSGIPTRSSAEDIVAGNLIELSVYGIASLYEKFATEAPKTDGTTAAPVTPAPMEPMAPAPVEPKTPAPMPTEPKAPAPVDPKTPAPMVPKM